MSLERLKAKVGLGGATIEVQIPKTKYRQNEVLKGKVLLSGGNVDQDITVVSISLIRDWSWECYSPGRDLDLWGDGRGSQSTYSVSDQSEFELDGERGHDEVVNIELGNDFKIKPKEERYLSFQIDLSSIHTEKGVSEKWKLKARADIPFAKDAIFERPIELIRHSNQGQKH